MLLKDCYDAYYSQASCLSDNWESMNINDLIRLGISKKDSCIYSQYVSAIICRFWKFLEKLYINNMKSATDDECYSWLLEAIMYALEYQPWKDDRSSLHNSSNAPERVIFKRCECNRINYYVACNRSKRVINHNHSTISIDTYYSDDEDNDKTMELPYIENSYESVESDYIQDIIDDFFESQDYLPAFILDIILLDNTVFDEDGNFSKKKLKGVISHIDDWFCEQFATKYGVSEALCKKQATKYLECNSQLIYDNIEIAIIKLKYCFKKLKIF